MPHQKITRQRIFRLLTAGFGLVILLLAAAAYLGLRNIRQIQATSQELLREESVSRHLLDELQKQQTNLTEVFSILARDPDSVDYYRIMGQLDQSDRDIDRIAAEGERTAVREL